MEGTVQRKTRGFYQASRGRGAYKKYNDHDDRVSSQNDRGDYYESRTSDRGSYSRGGGGRGYRNRSRGFSRGRGRGRGRGGPRGGVHDRLGSRPRPQNNDDDFLDEDGCVIMDGDSYARKKKFDPLSRNRSSGINKYKLDRRRDTKISPAASIIKERENYRDRTYKNRINPKVEVDVEKTWYQIKVFSGGDEVETQLIQKMSEIIDEEIVYRQYHIFNGAASFYVLGKRKADLILNCDGQITSIVGDEKLKVVRYVAKSDVYSDEQIASIQECIKNRVNIDQGVLDLSQMNFDENLNKQNIRLSLFRCDTFTIVVDTLKNLFGQSDQNERITTLNLGNNRLRYTSITFIKNHLIDMFPNVNRLLIAENQVETVEELKILRDWNLIELQLYDSSQDASVEDSESISDARKIFPDLIKLNCREYEPPVKIDVGEYELPKTLGNNFSLIPNDAAKETFINHIKNFFSSLDQVKTSDEVNNFYCEDSEFSLTIPTYNKDPTMAKYLAICKRQKKTADNRQRSRGGYHNNNNRKPLPQKYYFGREVIVQTLRKLPRTKHVMDSFVCDVTFCSNELISYVISGTFEEIGMNDKVRNRAFTRSVFCAISAAPDIKLIVLSDILHIRNHTVAEKKEIAKGAAAQLSQQPQTSAAPSDAQNEMVLKFMRESGMNMKWSRECLQNNGWNYELAGRNFMELKSNSCIPEEAFQL